MSFDQPDGCDETLFRDLHGRISRMASYYARCSGAEPDDLLQEAWLAVLQARGQYKPALGPLRPWLVRSARWRLLDVLKHRRFWETSAASPEEQSGRGDDERLEAEEFIESLTVVQQRIVRCLLIGSTWRDTGDELGCSSANVAYHMREIRQRYQLWTRAHSRESCLAVVDAEST